MKATAVKVLRLVALVEGVSFLALMFVAMPLKYMAGLPEAVTHVGWVHGWLFIGYIAVLTGVFAIGGIRAGRFGLGLAAGVVPFGTFLNDRGLKRDQQAAA